MNDTENERSQLEEELKELEKARPIKYGGLRFLFSLIMATGIIAALALSSHHWLFIEHEPVTPIGILSVFCVISLGVLPLFFALFYYFLRICAGNSVSQTWPFYWLKAYYQRNVRGSSAWLYLCGVYLPHGMEIFVEDSGRPIEAPPEHIVRHLKIAIPVPLGGWFNRPNHLDIYGPDNKGMKIRKLKARIDQVFPHTKTIILWLMDREGAKIRISAKRLLSILQEQCNFQHHLFNDAPRDIITLIHGLHISESVLRSEIKDAKSMSKDLELKLNSALDVIFKRSQEIKDTSRFGKSEEGRRLRESMEKDLLDLLPPDHAYRKVLERA